METLPNEIILKILSYCKRKDLINVGMTCSHFKSFIDSDKLWDMLLKMHYPWDCFKDYRQYCCLLMEHISVHDIHYVRYESLSYNAKDYYYFLEHLKNYRKYQYYQCIDDIWRHTICLKESYIPPYKKIIKEYEPEILYILSCKSYSDNNDCLLPLINYLTDKYKKPIGKKGIDKIKNILSVEIIAMLVGVKVEQKIDVDKYHNISKLLIKYGYSDKNNIVDWLGALNIPFYDLLLN